jgi:hypothetical protein
VSGLFVSTIILVSAAPTGFQNIGEWSRFFFPWEDTRPKLIFHSSKGWKYYLVLIVPAFVGSIAQFLWWPETRGLPLEVRHGDGLSLKRKRPDPLLLSLKQEVAKLWGDPVAVELGKAEDRERRATPEGTFDYESKQVVEMVDKV